MIGAPVCTVIPERVCVFAGAGGGRCVTADWQLKQVNSEGGGIQGG